MRIAALYDIHGNLHALKAVLRDVRSAGTELLVVGGDVVPGPLPVETLGVLQGLDIPVRYIYGNGEIAVLEQISGRESSAVPKQHRAMIRWTAEKIAGHEQWFAAWPMTVRITIPELGNILFCHATPRHENEIFTRLTTEERLLPVFEDTNANIVVCGHTHMQFDRMVGNTRVVNAGSVGMPFGKPGADWLLLGPGIELQHTDYDMVSAADTIRMSDYPDAESFIARSLMNPASEEEMLALFAGAELKYGN